MAGLIRVGGEGENGLALLSGNRSGSERRERRWAGEGGKLR